MLVHFTVYTLSNFIVFPLKGYLKFAFWCYRKKIYKMSIWYVLWKLVDTALRLVDLNSRIKTKITYYIQIRNGFFPIFLLHNHNLTSWNTLPFSFFIISVKNCTKTWKINFDLVFMLKWILWITQDLIRHSRSNSLI